MNLRENYKICLPFFQFFVRRMVLEDVGRLTCASLLVRAQKGILNNLALSRLA